MRAFIELAGHIKERMPRCVVEPIHERARPAPAPQEQARAFTCSTCLQGGPERHPEVAGAELDEDPGRQVLFYTDPYIPVLGEEGFELDSMPLDAARMKAVAWVVVLTDRLRSGRAQARNRSSTLATPCRDATRRT